jgi:hypothetical protein
MVARLDQFAATIADARTQPNLAALADLEQQFLTGFHEVGAHLDPVQVGAAWMILGNLFAGFVGGLPPEQQGCGPVLVNLARLAGARLYTGSGLPVTAQCPYTYGTGVECGKSYTQATQERLDALMRSHVALHHPGESWPPEVVIAGDGGPGTLSDGTGRVWPVGTPRPMHAPHELCDCRPGETYHCAAIGEPDEVFQPGPHEIHLIDQQPFDRLEITWAKDAEVDPTWGPRIARMARAIVAVGHLVEEAPDAKPALVHERDDTDGEEQS